MGNIAGNSERKKKCSSREQGVRSCLSLRPCPYVLHLICTKGITGVAKSKALVDEVLYLLWSPHLSLQPSLSSPLLRSLISLFLLRAERADCAALTGRSEGLCAALFSASQCDEKSLEKQCLGAELDPSEVCFISPHSLFLLFQMTAMISNETSYRCAPFDTLRSKTHSYACTECKVKKCISA